MQETFVVIGIALACTALVIWACMRDYNREHPIPPRPSLWSRLKARINRWLGDDPKNPRGYD